MTCSIAGLILRRWSIPEWTPGCSFFRPEGRRKEYTCQNQRIGILMSIPDPDTRLQATSRTNSYDQRGRVAHDILNVPRATESGNKINCDECESRSTGLRRQAPDAPLPFDPRRGAGFPNA